MYILWVIANCQINALGLHGYVHRQVHHIHQDRMNAALHLNKLTYFWWSLHSHHTQSWQAAKRWAKSYDLQGIENGVLK